MPVGAAAVATSVASADRVLVVLDDDPTGHPIRVWRSRTHPLGSGGFLLGVQTSGGNKNGPRRVCADQYPQLGTGRGRSPEPRSRHQRTGSCRPDWQRTVLREPQRLHVAWTLPPGTGRYRGNTQGGGRADDRRRGHLPRLPRRWAHHLRWRALHAERRNTHPPSPRRSSPRTPASVSGTRSSLATSKRNLPAGSGQPRSSFLI